MRRDDPEPLSLLDLAAAAFATCLQSSESPRDVVAEVSGAADLSPSQRTELARTVYAALQQRRRLEFALSSRTLAALPPAVVDLALILAARVASGAMTAALAAERCRDRTGVAIDFGGVRSVEERIAAIDDPVVRFGTRHSLPDWLAERLLAEHGDDAEGLAQALDAPAPRTLRANTLRVGSREELAAELSAEGVATRPTAYAPRGLHVEGDAPLFRLAAYEAGRFEQQDEASQLCALLVAPPPGGRVLDACAGSGGKTLAIAAMLGNKGEILAADTHAGRLQGLSARCRRAGVSNVRARLVGGEWSAEVDAFAARADRILLDVPCSGIGALRRRPEARWRLEPAALAAMAATQAALLDRAAARVRPGARIVYATCTVFAAENEAQVAAALARHPGFEQVRCKEILGGALGNAIGDVSGTFLRLRPDRHGTDGFFAAVLRRRR